MMVDRVLMFLDTKRPNSWLLAGPFELYVRRGIHLLDGKTVDTLDLASMEIVAPYRGIGTFTQFIDELEETPLPVEYIFVENVLMPRFQEFWARRGYSRKDARSIGLEGPPSFYKKVSISPAS